MYTKKRENFHHFHDLLQMSNYKHTFFFCLYVMPSYKFGIWAEWHVLIVAKPTQTSISSLTQVLHLWHLLAAASRPTIEVSTPPLVKEPRSHWWGWSVTNNIQWLTWDFWTPFILAWYVTYLNIIQWACRSQVDPRLSVSKSRKVW